MSTSARHNLRLAAPILLCFLALPVLAQTKELKAGIDAYWAGDYSTAVSTLKRFLESAELRVDILTARKFLAFAYLAVDEKERAVAEFEKVLDEDPGYDISPSDAAPSTIKVWKEVKDRRKAAEDEKKKKAKAEGLMEDAKHLFAQGNYVQAQAGFREVLKLDPQNQFAKAYLEQLADRARSSAPPTVSAMPPGETPPPAPDSVPTDGGMRSGGPELVSEQPLDSMPSEPKTPAPPPPTPSVSVPDIWVPTDAKEVARYNKGMKLNNDGLKLFEEGRYQDAVRLFEQAVQSYNLHPMFHWNLGLGYERSRREDLSLREYKFVIQADPQGYGARARRQLGLLHFRQQRWIEAAREFEESLRVAPEDLDTRRYLAQAYQQAGNLDNAIQTMVILVQSSPNSADDRYLLGDLHRKRGNTHAALAEFRELVRIAPNHAQAANVKAFIKANEEPPAVP